MTEHELDTLLRDYGGAVRSVCRAILPGHPQDAEEAEAEQIYVADVTSNGETTRQYLRTDKAGRNGTVSVKTFELGDAE